MKARSRAVYGLVLVLLGVSAGRLANARTDSAFDHLKHRDLFPSCQSCHVGAVDQGYAMWPAAENCAACHDGEVEDRVNWTPPAEASPSNLRFTHGKHREIFRARNGADSSLGCVTCHTAAGAQRMDVQHAVVEQCISCHQPGGSHLSLPDSACGSCHVTLAQATRLTEATIAAFPVPPSHRQPRFVLAGHGQSVKTAGGTSPVPASCATCHARDFCTECHVDALEQRAIRALAPDTRSLIHKARLPVPASHQSETFIYRHGAAARRSAQDCRTCHTRESCTACHVNQPRAVNELARWEPGRGRGAQVGRVRPASHETGFRDQHAALATASPGTCTTCHTRTECLDCHRPTAASVRGYHPSGFLTRHPAAAYSRESSCADCHSPTGFCAACHQQSGLVASRTLRPGYHDAKQFFLAGHGQAARQSLESCVGCHTERDCLTCHSSRGGRRFNPHGPGFDGARLKRKNPEMCTACHGVAIP
jgi:hypothetical protein